MNFLSSILREEGGFEYKKSIVECILRIIQEIPEAKDAGLAQLSEFIEDCETHIFPQILHILGEQVHSHQIPANISAIYTTE